MAIQFTCRKGFRLKRILNPKICLSDFLTTWQDESLSTTPTFKDDKKLPPNRKLEFDALSLKQRGYLRSQKPYSPPKDVEDIILNICRKHCDFESGSFNGGQIKFRILKECSDTLDYTVPNSLLHRITNIDELCLFYKTPVNLQVPLDQMKDKDLPKNVHVIYNYVRFHPETDTMFGGVSAFPESSTLMQSLKAKKKYSGYSAKKKSL